jgi:tellurium resistance protein TerZ
VTRLRPGESIPLNVTLKANHRIFAGLGWDPQAKSGFLHKIGALIGRKKPYHDLDLGCFLYDQSGKMIDHVAADTDHQAVQDGAVYHSGDNVEGLGDGDDEQISVELKRLAPEVTHIVFTATIKSGHTFGEVESPEIRLVDGYSNHQFLRSNLCHEGGRDKSAFIFVRIQRDGERWVMHYIKKFTDFGPDWYKNIPPYL